MLPLRGFRVLDFSQNGDGPACGLMLAEAGADVIKIEPLQGDAFRHGATFTLFYNVNRNKRSLALNLRSEEGRAIAHRLASKADIVLESFTPGVADMLGIGYHELRKLNPRLIYCSVSGFGQTGPYRHKPAYDPVIHAISGLMAVTGEPGRPPIRMAPNIVGLPTAFLAGYSILLAVIAREKTGEGQLIDASFFDTAVYFMAPFITGYALTGYVMPKMGSANPAYTPYQCFQSADRYVFVGVSNEKFWQAFCRALGFAEMADDSRYSSMQNRLLNRDELVETLTGLLGKIPGDEILRKLESAGVPCAPVLEIPEVLENPQVKARQMFFDMQYPGVGEIKLAHIPARPSDIEPVQDIRAPLLGEHTREILLEAGYTSIEIDSFAAKGVILKG
jgi:crotonobetainyl-CoA:carnitine CoA-transferase CaiB-like acyl-CoA transferase